MYNIHSHYENIFNFLRTIIADPRIIYLHPFGTTSIGNIEFIRQDLPFLLDHTRGPLFICYDNEPLDANYNKELFDHIKSTNNGPYILLNTEIDSTEKNKILKEHGFIDCYYFYHAFAAADWYRGYKYNSQLVPLEKRNIKKKYIAFNRLTSNKRVYRTLLVAELAKRNLLDMGYVSYSDVCPDTESHFSDELDKHAAEYNIDVTEYKKALQGIDLPLRIDTPKDSIIENCSQTLSAVDKTQEALFQIVTETVFWDRKKHLTEKIFKPIVSMNPFILVGPAHNLKYLKYYGFKTFDRWIDESYDDIEDGHERLNAVVDVIESLKDMPNDVILEMREVLEHNYNHFYSKEFIDICWRELTSNLFRAVIDSGEYIIPQD